MKIKKGDTVLIISGKARGRRGKVLNVFPRGTKGARVVVENVNMIKKQVRPKKSGQKGQIIQTPAPISISNVKLVCPKCGRPTRVGYKVEGKRKYRACKKCSGEI